MLTVGSRMCNISFSVLSNYNVFTGSLALRKDQTSNAGTADLADSMERLSFITKTLEIRTGRQ